jgi:uncharacterized membrane protein
VKYLAKGRILLVLGVILVFLGAILLWMGIQGPTEPLPCPSTGCHDWVEIFSGLAIIIVGIAMIIASRKSPHMTGN